MQGVLFRELTREPPADAHIAVVVDDGAEDVPVLGGSRHDEGATRLDFSIKETPLSSDARLGVGGCNTMTMQPRLRCARKLVGHQLPLDPVATLSPNDAVATQPLAIDVVSDVVCPWCYIGKRKLEQALSELRSHEPRIDLAVRWHPFQLNPDLPAAGMPRAAYLEAKLGGKARAADVYARVRAVGEEVGIAFDFDRIAQQPNTLDAHRLIAWAQQRGDVDALVETLFRRYFIEGRFIGDRGELAAAAAACGLPEGEARSLLESEALRSEVEAESREAQEAGISGVPFFIFNGRTAVSGAHDPATLLEAIAAARSPQ